MGTVHKIQPVQWPVETDHGKFLTLFHKLPPSLLRFVKFCIVGGSGVLVDMTVLYLLADPSRFGWSITLSKICAAEIAMINNFVWNEHWTFSVKSSPPLVTVGVESSSVKSRQWLGVFSRLIVFNAICGIGIVLAVMLLHFFHTCLGWSLYLSNFLAIVLVTFWNFVVNSRYNWKLRSIRCWFL